ncbi:MAG: FAD-dependent monooxygenase [Pseudomonadota bacterium]
MTAKNPAEFDLAIVGGGATGLATALLVAKRTRAAGGRPPQIAVIAPKPVPTERRMANEHGITRTAAVFQDGCGLLEEAGASAALFDQGAALKAIRMIDISDRLLRAPDVTFQANELGLEAFGYNLANADIAASLEEAVAKETQIQRLEATVTDVAWQEEAVVLILRTGREIAASSVVAADGRKSLVRQAAGISTRRSDSGQAALIAKFGHSRPHNGISTELHDAGGPCTSVPLPGDTSSLVWMMPEADAQAYVSDDRGTRRLQRDLQSRVGSFLGTLGDFSSPVAIPLMSFTANPLAHRRIFLIGEAGHAFPPIGAQGLNLGLRDADDAATMISQTLVDGGDPGASAITQRYHRRRWLDVQARTQGVDLFNRSLTGDIAGLALARGAGLHALRAVPGLRRFLMRQGMRGLTIPSAITNVRIGSDRGADA